MLVRLGLRAAVNLAAGIGVGLLAIAAMSACKRRKHNAAASEPGGDDAAVD